MRRPTVTNGENREPKRVDIYEEFVLWSAMPPSERSKLGIETQEQFVEFYKIGINTPTKWKRRPDYEPRVTAIRREWAFEKTGMVIEGIYRAALRGNPHSQKLWLQYFHGFSEKHDVAVTQRPTASANDVIALIGALPEEKRKKHYDWVIELMLHCSIAYQKAKDDGDTSLWDKPLPADWMPRYIVKDTLEEVEEELLEAPQPQTIQKLPAPLQAYVSCDSAASRTSTADVSFTVASPKASLWFGAATF